jgi:hypothetical protein
MLTVSNRSGSFSWLQIQLERLIERDVARITDLSHRYTCCPGFCTADPESINTASSCATDSNNSGSDQYYSPVQPNIPVGGSFTAEMTDFRILCGTEGYEDESDFGTLADNLITAFPVLGSAPERTTLVRSTPSVVDARSHRIEWTYTATINGSTVISRVVNMIPTVAGWCP